ncbi:DUF6049 family protein [Cellulomonas sp. P22]|uniref:DUF6049 family protein n=1 Tax=Cellulomonas sp. P22 TaxID=3373189 RepID=UPI00379ADD68
MNRSPRTGLTTHRGRRGALGLLVGLLTLLGVLGPVLPGDAGAAVAAPAAPTTSTLPTDVSVTSVSPQVLAPDVDLTVTAVVRNTSDTTIENPNAVLRISRYRLASADRLAAWTEADATADAGSKAQTVALGAPLEPGASAEVVLTVPAASVGLLRSADAWGPRGIAVELTDGSRRAGIARTFLLWAPSQDVSPVGVGVLVPVVGPHLTMQDAGASPADGTTATAPLDGSQDDPADVAVDTGAITQITDPTLEALTSTGGRLRLLLDATTPSSAVSWAVDPSLVERAAAGGPMSTAWLEDLTSGTQGRDVLALPWADPDLAAVAHGRRPDLLDLALSTSTDASAEVLGPDPTQLLWAADDVPDQVTAALAAGSDAAGLVVGADALAPEGRTVPSPAARASVTTAQGRLEALVPDATLSALLAAPTTVEPGATAATVAQRVLAETAVAARTRSDQQILIAAPRDWEPDGTLVAAQLQALSDAPWVDLTSVSDLLRTRADTTERATLPTSSASSTELSPAHINALAEARSLVATFAQVVPDPQALLVGLDREILAPMSVAWRGDPTGRKALVDTVLDGATERRNGLSVLLNEQVTVAASSSQIRMVVRNTLDQDATVRVEMRPRQSCLRAVDSPTVTVPADSESTVVVDVRATSSCDVTVEVLLLAQDGTVVAAPASFSARVTPTIEDVGMTVVGILLTIGLVAGIVRTVRRGQTAHRGARVAAQVRAEEEAAREAEAASGPPPQDPQPGPSSSADPRSTPQEDMR